MPSREIKFPVIRETKDGSSTLFSPGFNQHYHNPNGAVSESRHVFFKTPGVPESIKQNNELSIFEVGFGTGLNLLLGLDYLDKLNSKTRITFTSIEAFPIDYKTAGNMEFGDEPFLNQSKNHLVRIFKSLKPGINRFDISENLTLNLFIGFFDDFFEHQKNIIAIKKAGFIFHDPFSPDVNAELWTPDVFEKLAGISGPETILSTYCAATSARAAMAVAGWKVARARGALGKREMTVASLNPDKLSSFNRVNEKRLIERFENGDFNS